MLKREHLPHMLGAATLALMFSAASVHPQTTTTGTSGTAATTGTSSTAADSRAPGASGGSAASGASATPSTGSQGSGASGSAAATSGASEKSASASSKAEGSLSKGDQSILRQMAITNISEIEAAKLAQSKSKDEKVKTYAQQMIDDHTKAQGELEQLAQSKNVTLPKEPDAKHKAMAKKLSALEGEKFDKQYMAQGGVTDHRNAHGMLQKAEKTAKDPEVKALVTKMIPVVDQHLQTARQDTASAKTASGKGGASSGSSGASGGAASTGAGSAGSGSGSTGK
jgi:putative membrane protein